MSNIRSRWHQQFKEWGYRYTFLLNTKWRVEGDHNRWTVVFSGALISNERFPDSTSAMHHAESLMRAQQLIRELRLTRSTNRRTR